MQNIIIGFLLATVGMTTLNAIGDIIATVAELIKAFIAVGIQQCNTKIQCKEEPKPTPKMQIGFATNIKEDEENDE